MNRHVRVGPSNNREYPEVPDTPWTYCSADQVLVLQDRELAVLHDQHLEGILVEAVVVLG